MLGSTAPLGVGVGSSPTPITSPPSTTVQAGPLGLNLLFTPNTSKRTSPRSAAPTATPVVPNLPPSDDKEDDDNNNNNINDMHRQLQLLCIAGSTTTSTVTTTYKDNGSPTVTSHSMSTRN